MRRDRLIWFGHLELNTEEDWVLVCRNMEVLGKILGQRKEDFGRMLFMTWNCLAYSPNG